MRSFPAIAFLLGVSLTFAAGPVIRDSTYWRDFRGPNRAGIYDETEILTRWPDSGLPLLWKTGVGIAYSGITVADGRVFTIEQRTQGETVSAYDFATGKELWSATWKGKYSSFLGGKGPRATPVWDDGRLYAQGAEGVLKCLNAEDGSEIWARNIVSDNGAKNVRWGTAASPLILDKMLITAPGAAGGKSVVAYDKLTGDRLWSALDDKPSYASPMVATLAGTRQILITNAAGVSGLSLDGGKRLWHYPWKTSHNVNATQPVIAGERRFLISSGYGHGAAMVELTGDPDEFEPKTVWQNKFLKSKFNTAVLHDGYVYGLDDGILTCLDAESGARQWKAGRYGYGQVLLAGDHLLITAATGEAVLVKATPDGHDEVSRFQAVEGKTWNTPALAGGCLLVRSLKEMACYRIAP